MLAWFAPYANLRIEIVLPSYRQEHIMPRIRLSRPEHGIPFRLTPDSAGLEKLLGTPIEKIRVTDRGLEI